jgi:methionyl-tRNA formyltransferase
MPEKKENLRVIFMGTPDISANILEALLQDSYNIISVYTQPDKKVGRKQVIQKTPVKILAEKNNIPVYDPRKLDEITITQLREQKPDLIILIAYGKILPPAFLDAPSLGAVNIHPSLLPKFRGPSPIQNALLTGEKITGTTIMLMDAGMDTGEILKQAEIEITSTELYAELEKKLTQLSIEILLETLPKWLNGEIMPQKQDDSMATYCKMIRKADGQINWNDSAQVLYNKYRAFSAWPGIFTLWNDKRLKLSNIKFVANNSASHKTGEVFEVDNIIYVQTNSGVIELAEVQLEGKPNTKIVDFVNGHKDFIGSILKN